MAGLTNKYLVQRIDGTVPSWPYLVLGAADPEAPAAIRYYADGCEMAGMAADYVADLRKLADSFEQWRELNSTGDPDAPPHRAPDPEILSRMRAGSTPQDWKAPL